MFPSESARLLTDAHDQQSLPPMAAGYGTFQALKHQALSIQSGDSGFSNDSLTYSNSTPVIHRSKLHKCCWRFGQVMLYVFYHAAVFTGVTLSYSLVAASFVAYLENPEEQDQFVFEITYWITLILAIFTGLHETREYISLLHQAMQCNGSEFEALLKQKYAGLLHKFNKSSAMIKTGLDGMSFGLSVANIYSLTTNFDNFKAQTTILRSIAGLGSLAGAAVYWQQDNGYEAGKEIGKLHNKTSLARSFGISIVSVGSYIYNIMDRLHRRQKHLGAEERQEVYVTLALFCALALYYEGRISYEQHIERHQEKDPDVRSSFQNIEKTMHHCIAKCSPRSANILARLAGAVGNLTKGVMSLAQLYILWSSWRTAVSTMGFINDDDLTLHPNTVAEVGILLLLGWGHVAARFSELYVVCGKKSPDSTPLLPLQSQ